MPHIIVMARRGSDNEMGTVMHRERVSPADFESGHFASQLVERIGWAVCDADEVEQQAPATDAPEPATDAPEPATDAAEPEPDDTEPQPDPIWAAHAIR